MSIKLIFDDEIRKSIRIPDSFDELQGMIKETF